MDEEGLAIVCSTLGNFEESANGHDVYHKHEECSESLKDLQRYMRRDHPESRDVFMQLGKWNIVRRDIVPLIVRYSDDHELVLNCVKVLVFLTMPIDPSSHQVSLQIEYLQYFRAALLDDETIPVMMSLLEEPLLHLERGAPKEDDWKILQLFLTLLRNLLAIPDAFTHHISASTQYAFLKERLLEILFNESVMELVVALTQHTAGRQAGLRQDNFLILEILHQILIGQRPEIVASAPEKNTKVKKLSEMSSVTLRALMHEERAQLKSTRYDPALHAPFSGMFVRVAQDGTKTILTRTPHQSPLENLLRKPQIKRGPIKRVFTENTSVRPTNDQLQVLLKDFVNQFLASGYNVLMQTIKDDLRREGANNEAIDPVPFFHVVEFFTASLCRIAQKDQEKCRQSSTSTETGGSGMESQKHICGSIASTLDEEMFVLVRSNLCYYIDEAQTTKNWGPVAAGIAVMKEMIHMLDIVLKRPGPIDKEAALELRTARILLYKVFYDQTDTGIIQTVITLLKSFDIHKQSRSFLADLVEITHIILRLLEAATKEGTLRVLKKVRGGRKKVKSASKKADENVSGAPEVKVVLRTDADQDELGRSDVATSELGPEPADIIGAENVSTDDLGVSEGSEKTIGNEHTGNLTSGNNENWGENTVSANLIDDDCDDDDDDEPESLTKEVSLDVKQLVVKRFADNTIVRNYSWLLKYYSSNSATTNYYVVRLLERICEDQVLEPMLYQLSIFQTFYTILSDKQLRAASDHKFVVAFLTKVVRGFFIKLKSQPMLFIDVLFWKLKHECAIISADYMIHDLKRALSGSSRGRQRVNIADALGDDEDSVPHSKAHDGIDGPSDNDDFGSSGDDDQFDSPSSSECNSLSEFQESQLKELFEKYKDEDDWAQLISQELDPSAGITSKQVKRKLLHLGLLDHHVRKAKKRRTSNSGELNDSRNLGRRESRKVKRNVDSANGAEGSKSKKSNLFTTSEDDELRQLFLRHGNSRKCSRTIAESLGGLFTPAQIARRLRTLGLVKSKPKSKLQSFLTNVLDGDEDGGSDEGNVAELYVRKEPNTPNKVTSFDLSGESEADDNMSIDDDAPLGSILRSAAFPGRASMSGAQDEPQTNISLSRPLLKATIGRDARQKACKKGKEKVGSYNTDNNHTVHLAATTTGLSQAESHGKTSVSKSAVTEKGEQTTGVPRGYMHDHRSVEEVGGTRTDEGIDSVGLLTNLLENRTEITGCNSEHLPSGSHGASSGTNVRRIPQTEEDCKADELLECEITADGLRASWGPNARRRSRGVSSEDTAVAGDVTGNPETQAQSQEPPTVKLSNTQANSSDSTKQTKDLAKVAFRNYTTVAWSSGVKEPPNPTNGAESFQRNVSKRRRLARKLPRSEVSEDEDLEVTGNSLPQDLHHQQQVCTEENVVVDDELNDF